ncbi:MAG: PDZ domain-containing protein [Acidobacteriota bacterium]|nr:PDZ domain-containing protein [Acidobacteriota bacterium]
MMIPDVEDHLLVQIPAWNALYQVRDFSAHIQHVEAYEAATPSGNAPVKESPAAIEKVDKQTWRISAHGTVRIRYSTYWDEPGPFATQLNQEHAFINPAMVLMYVPDRRGEPVRLGLQDVPELWQARGPGIQGFESMGGVRNFFAEFSSYDGLADAPIEAGKFEAFQLEDVKPEIWVVVHGDNWKKKQVASDLKRICEYEIKLMGGAPYARYTFILHIGKGAAGTGGGMEHADGTAISVASGENLQNVAAHEFFHLWNVKRIIPASLYPVDYSKEQYTRALWFAEGVTNTYGSYTLERTGLWSKQQFYHDLGEQITELEARPARLWQSAEQSSLDAWLEKYPLYENPNYSVSYYTKGQILGVLLDILIRDRSENSKSLDDVLRAMNKDFAAIGNTYRDSLDVQLIAEKLTGVSFEEFFKRYIAGADALPYRTTFALAGLELREVERKRPALGFAAEPIAGGLLAVSNVESDGPAAGAGLKTDDVILKWNGSEPPRRPNNWLRQQKAGATIHLRVRREDVEMNIDMRLGEVSETFYELAEDSHAGEKARHIRDGLLRGVTDAVAIHASN